MNVTEKIGVLADAAKYDASCSTAGSARKNTPEGIGTGAVGGICHAWSSDGRCVALLKVLLSNACVYDCAYCVNRRSNDVRRAGFEPEELVRLIIDFYKRNYIEGAFLSSGVLGCPDATMERLIWVARTLRTRERYNGYIHLKIIPGSSEALVLEAARWADRVSVNIELPTAASLKRIAPDKKPSAILGPMRFLAEAGGFLPAGASPRQTLGTPGGNTPLDSDIGGFVPGGITLVPRSKPRPLEARRPKVSVMEARKTRTWNPGASLMPAGQTTQMVVGASPESDAVILGLAERLYLTYDVRRVYYSAFIPTGGDPRLPVVEKPPLAREHRLYQADWLFRFYGYKASEILDPDRPFLENELDPKSSWALRNLRLFPLELLAADYLELLRVPGIGPKSASRIVTARRSGRLGIESLSRLGVVMRRAKWFVTVGGRLASAGDPDASIPSPMAPARGPSRVLERPEFLRDLLLDPAFRNSESCQPELPWRT
ncbi:MAG: putative DNA modification/repair radical SAM protein [Spirochaetes bacterium]|nr:putative DNA modification/repair radical SAM protein [Spirochaetota bacterium]